MANTNPATALAELLGTWRNVPARSNSVQVRGDKPPGDLAFWQNQASAVDLVREVDRSLLGLRESGVEVDDWIKVLPAWYRAAMAFETGWKETSQQNRSIIKEGEIALLRALGTLLTSTGYAPNPEPDVELISQLLEEVHDLVKTTPDLPDPERRYLFGLVSEAHSVLREVDTFGWSAPRRTVFELTGAMQSQAALLHIKDGNNGRAKVWSRWALHIALSVATAFGMGAGQELASSSWELLEIGESPDDSAGPDGVES